MKNRKLIGSAVLVLGLLAAGASFAEEAGTASSTTPDASYGKEVRAKMANMTPAQREAFRAEMKDKMDKMTPEQREKLKAEHMEHRAEHRADRMEHRAEHRTERMEHRTERMEHRTERPGK